MPKKSAVDLHSGDVRLRLLSVADSATLEQLLTANRDWLETWEATVPGSRVSAPFAPKAALRRIVGLYRQGASLPMIIEYRGEVVGQLTVSPIERGSVSSAQLGYWISEDFAGRGIVPIAVALAVDHMIAGERLHRIEVCIRPENRASLRVVEKLGFRFEGVRVRYIYIDGAWRDHHCFALTAEELGGGLLPRALAL